MAWIYDQNMGDATSSYTPFAPQPGQANPEFNQWFQQATSSYQRPSYATDPLATGQGTIWWTAPDGQRYAIEPTYGASTDPRDAADIGAGAVTNFDPSNIQSWTIARDTGQWGVEGTSVPYDMFDPSGQYLRSGTHQFNNEAQMREGLTIMAAMMAAGFGGGALLGGAGEAAGAGAVGASGAGAGTGAVGGAGGFIGEGAASGIPYWDAALANSPSWTAASGYGGTGLFNAAQDSQAANVAIDAAGGPGTALQGYQSAGIPSVTVNGAPSGSWWDSLTNAFTPSPGSAASNALSSLTGGGGTGSNLLGLGSTLLGGLSGAQGQQGSTSSTRQMDPRLDQPVYGAGGLVPRTQETLASQYPMAQQYGGQLMSTGSNLLGQTAPTTATNPYLSSITDDMQRRTQELLGENNRALQGNAIGVGGLGGSRQGVAQGVAAGRAADSLQGQIANLYGQAYNQDQNRLRQDWTIGSGLLNQGQQMQFAPMQSTSNIYQPFTGFGTTTQNADSGGGWSSALGGLLSGASFARTMGWL